MSPNSSIKSPASNKTARPLVAVNFALTFDGKISTRNFTPSDFSSRRDKLRLLEIRAAGDAVLVGKGTLEKENMAMGLPARELRAERLGRGMAEYPFRVIVTNSGRLDPALKVFQNRLSPVLVYSTRRMPKHTRNALAPLCTLRLHETGTVDLRGMLEELRKVHKVKRLVCEGGPTLLRSLLALRLVDEINLTVCPRIFGGAKAPGLTGVPGDFLPQTIEGRLLKMETIGGECFLRYKILHPV
jgi:riboflavin-specific deaminase-like protein